MESSLIVDIDPAAGFCFGVARAVALAEQQLKTYGSIYCLGSIVHNNKEVQRLEQMGLKIISHDDLKKLSGTRVLIRAHGEPPETYRIAQQNDIELIDATCKVVLRLQSRIKKDFLSSAEHNRQVVIYGKKGHPEVDGLMGQTLDQAILVNDNDLESLDQIDYSKSVILYCQTTQSLEGYARLVNVIKERIADQQTGTECFTAHDTICRQVAGRGPRLEKFAQSHDVVIFVSGNESSNGRFLFEMCKKVNPDSYKVSGPEEVSEDWFTAGNRVGVSGATSTPQWLMDQVSEKVKSFKI